MGEFKYVLLVTISSLLLQAATPPYQPLTGPGGSTYRFGSVTASGPFNDGAPCPGVGCNEGLTYYIYQPSNPTPTAGLPVVLFLHGYSAENPESYMGWIEHITRNGYTVIWTNWDDDEDAGGETVVSNEMTAFQNAITRIQNNASYVKLADDSKGIVRAAVAGHSGGAFTGFRVASLSWDASNGIPPIRAIAAMNPGQGQMPNYDVSAIDPSTKAIIVVGSAETACEQYDGAKLFDLLSMVPTSSKSFLEALTDDHGSPGLAGDHNFPLTLQPNFALDTMDFMVSFRLSVALFDCTFYGVYCNLANGGPGQPNMGVWSDNVPVTPLLRFTADPETTFPWPGASCTE